MWTFRRALLPRLIRTAGSGPTLILLSLLSAGCSSRGPVTTLVASGCQSVDGQHEVTLEMASPVAGTLRVAIAEWGVTLIATLDGNQASAAASPLERFGRIFLITKTLGAQAHRIRIRANDSPQMRGQVCVEAHVIPDSRRTRADRVLMQAESAYAQGGRATQNQAWPAAFEGYLAAARGFDRLGRRTDAAAARQALAELAYRRFDRKRDAYALAAQALSDYGAGADPIFKGLLAGLRANSLLGMPGSDPHAVAANVRDLLAQARHFDSSSRYGSRELPRLEIMTGYLEYNLDAPARASAIFTQAAQHCRDSADWGCYAVASQNLALLQESSNYESAMAAYTDALRQLPVGVEPRLRADIMNNLGRLQGVAGLFSASERSHEAAMREYAQLGDCPGVRRSMSRLGTLMTQLGLVGDAETYLQRAAGLACGDLLAAAGSAQATNNLPAIADLGTAKRESSMSPTRRESLCSHPLDVTTLANENRAVVFNSLLSLSNMLMMEGELTEAQRCLEAARPYTVDSRTHIRLDNANGSMLLEKADAAGARAAFAEALRTADEARLSATYEHRGIARLGVLKAADLAGNASETLAQAYQALQASVERGDADQTVTSLRLIAAGYGPANPREAARTLLTAADLIEAVPIDQLDGEKRATYLATQYSVFSDLTDLLAPPAQTDASLAWQAFSTSERGRARSLRYAVTQATRAEADALEPVPSARYREMLRQVAQIAQNSPATHGEDLVEQLDALTRSERVEGETLDREQLARALNELDATLIEYAAGARDMFAFIVHGASVQVVRVGERRLIAAAAAELLDGLRDPETPPGTIRGAAAKLAQLVLWPLTDKLSGKRLIFVPDDALHTVPFSVLPWSANASDQLVLQHAEVSSIPSALFVERSADRPASRTQAPRMQLVGDPVFGVGNWRRECLQGQAAEAPARPEQRSAFDWVDSLPRLPGSRAEVLGIAKLAHEYRPGARVETALGCEAVPDVLRQAAAERVELLHIATHARVDAQRPRLSALALTPESTDAGTAAFGLLDILRLKLNSSLVVLSACDTSRGRLLAGEGVLGPAQAFLQAGAAAVVASYWRVNDAATSTFMQGFYRHLLADRLPASSALRQAQLDEWRQSSSYAWAAFALYGRPDTSL